MQVMDPRQANFQETVNLVERNTAPGGYQLVCPEESGKIRSQFDLVELAGEIQTADKFTRATAGSKLSVIAEQVRFLQEQARIIKRRLLDSLSNSYFCRKWAFWAARLKVGKFQIEFMMQSFLPKYDFKNSF